MSNAYENWDDATPPHAIDMRAAELVERRDAGDWTDEDESALEKWLSASLAHRVAFLRLNSSWKRTERLVALRAPEYEENVPGNPRMWSRSLKIGAGLGALLVFGGLLAGYFSIPRYDSYATTVGSRKTLALRDGSQIEMNTNTHLRVSQNTSQRLVQLESGEAYFHIRHDATHPFIVIAAGHRVVDLGTSFSVRTDFDKLKVALVDGRVRIDATDRSGHPRHTILSPGDVLVASANTLSVKRKTFGDLTNSLAWRRGMLVFHETTLGDAASEFNRYNETKIIINDSAIAKEAINGTLPSNDLREFSRMARNIFGLRTEKRGNAIVFAR